MNLRTRHALARVLLLALVFRVGLGFGHGPVVSDLPDTLAQSFCGPLPTSEIPGVPYQGCPICHALAWAADMGHGLVSGESLLRLDFDRSTPHAAREPLFYDIPGHRLYRPRAPPGLAAA